MPRSFEARLCSVASIEPSRNSWELTASELDDLVSAVKHMHSMLSEMHRFFCAQNPAYVESVEYLKNIAVLEEADKYCR